MSETAFRRHKRLVTCQACGSLFRAPDPSPYCCASCEEADLARWEAEWEGKARAAGFESLDEYLAYQRSFLDEWRDA
jgi:endogenous inhibitor of DNA gyrase (YacG/DUF329 family)